MKQALILCAGQAQRLRPFSHLLPKAEMPFLNLPLLALSWLYLELMGVDRFLLNACFFPEKIKALAGFLSRPRQSIRISFEQQPLGAVGTLRHLKTQLQKEKSFFYINGDSLFFPSRQSCFTHFEEDFINQKACALFFGSPVPLSPPSVSLSPSVFPASPALSVKGAVDLLPASLSSPLPQEGFSKDPSNPAGVENTNPAHSVKAHQMFLQKSNPAGVENTNPAQSFLWTDANRRLQYAGPKAHNNHTLKPFYFSGLALFKSSLLDELPNKGMHLFSDFINPLANKKRLMVFEDKAFCFEAGRQRGLTQATTFSLKNLFDPQATAHTLEWQRILKKLFARFDPQDQTVGLKNGQSWGKKSGNQPLLAPISVKGLKFLNLKGPAVIGPQAQLFGESQLKNAILGAGVSWRGPLLDQMVLSPELVFSTPSSLPLLKPSP